MRCRIRNTTGTYTSIHEATRGKRKTRLYKVGGEAWCDKVEVSGGLPYVSFIKALFATRRVAEGSGVRRIASLEIDVPKVLYPNPNLPFERSQTQLRFQLNDM